MKLTFHFYSVSEISVWREQPVAFGILWGKIPHLRGCGHTALLPQRSESKNGRDLVFVCGGSEEERERNIHILKETRMQTNGVRVRGQRVQAHAAASETVFPVTCVFQLDLTESFKNLPK